MNAQYFSGTDKYLRIEASSELSDAAVMRELDKIIKHNTRDSEYGISSSLSAMTAQQYYDEPSGKLAWKIELLFSHK